MMKILLLILLLGLHFFTQAQTSISYQPIATGFTQPVAVVNAGDERLFIIERSGIIKVYKNNSVLATPFLDIRHKTSTDGDRGLLSLAFHPNYIKNGYLYVYYTEKTSNLTSSGAITIARYKVSTVDENVVDPNSGVVLLSLLKPQDNLGVTFADHNGGDLHFGRDGSLYFATGDGGKQSGMEAPGDPYNNSQNSTSPLGKFIKFNVDNTAYVDTTILAKGLRNPWRWSFDKLNGNAWIGDVGHYKWEEVNLIKNEGKTANEIKLNKFYNFGWRCYEANEVYNYSDCSENTTFDFPIFKYVNARSSGGSPASITGGYVYRGKNFPGLYGYYISSDLFSGTVYFIKETNRGGWSFSSQTGLQNGIVSFGEDRKGELYAVSIFNGTLYKVIYTGQNKPIIKNGINIFPNPVQDGFMNLQIDNLQLGSYHIRVVNKNGQIVETKKVDHLIEYTIHNIPLNIRPGMYDVHVTYPDGSLEINKVLVL